MLIRFNGNEVRIVLGNYNRQGYVVDNDKLISEWNWKKNNELGFNPKELTCGSGQRVWWVCERGHEWESTINNRNIGYGCPHCRKEKQTSFPEQAIFFYCKKVTDAKNRHTEFGKEIDIYLPEYNVGIEYNGSYWHENKRKRKSDDDKIKYFADKGIRIITVKEGSENIINGDTIEHTRKSNNKTYINFIVKCIFNLIGIKFNNIDVERDMGEIFEQYIELEKQNSIAVKNPKSVIEWDYEKNGQLLPTMVSHGSNKRVWWKCKKCGHSWKAGIHHYTGKGCAKCAQRNAGKNNCKPICCVETNKIYKSAREAQMKTGIKHQRISSACNGKQKTAGGYHWEFVNNKDNNCKIGASVRCIETNRIYKSISCAARETGIRRSTISSVCHGTGRTAGGYHWELVIEN